MYDFCLYLLEQSGLGNIFIVDDLRHCPGPAQLSHMHFGWGWVSPQDRKRLANPPPFGVIRPAGTALKPPFHIIYSMHDISVTDIDRRRRNVPSGL